VTGSPTIRSFAEADRAAVVDLWRRAELVRPWNDPDLDIDRKLAVGDGLLLVAEDGEPPRVVATVMVGYDGHRGWLNYLAVDPARRRAGIGRLLVAEAEARLLALGCPKVNLMVRSTNPGAVAFYEAIGYAVDDVTALGRRLIRDD
jgi:ribosomal protein S18 acetylase RimI-like enzyme